MGNVGGIVNAVPLVEVVLDPVDLDLQAALEDDSELLAAMGIPFVAAAGVGLKPDEERLHHFVHIATR